MSTSKNGLQYCLDKLGFYCDKWNQQINIRKTKIVLFNRQGSLIKEHKFQFKENIIETVREYKYLGFVLSCSGSTTTGITNLMNHAKKSMVCYEALSNFIKKQKY